jgi:hypothetical protein
MNDYVYYMRGGYLCFSFMQSTEGGGTNADGAYTTTQLMAFPGITP